MIVELGNWFPIRLYKGGAVTDADVDGVIIRKKNGIYYKRNYTSEINANSFGTLQDSLNAQEKAGTEVEVVTYPKDTVYLPSLTIPDNTRFSYYGPTREKIQFSSQVATDGTPVNEWIFQAPYHPALLLDTYDNLNATTKETQTRRGASLAIRRNGFSVFQTYWSLMGKQEHSFKYEGSVNITVTGDATSAGTISFKLNGITYSATIAATDTQADIVNKINAVVLDEYWSWKQITGNIVRIHPKDHTFILIQNKAAGDGDFPVVIEGVTYNIPVLATDTPTEIATKIAGSSVIPASTYVMYHYGATVQVFRKDGGISEKTTASIVSNNTGAAIQIAVVGTIGTYNNMVSSARGMTGFGMWHPQTYQVEIANALRIIADSDNNMVQTDNALLVLENAKAGYKKLLRLVSTGSLNFYGNSGTNLLMSIDDQGNITGIKDITATNVRNVNRVTFNDTLRFITTLVLGSEKAFYISNEAGSGYIARFSDANGLELNVSGNYKKVQTVSSGTTTERPIDQNTGFQYFDTTLNKPIWFSGTGWVDATGTAV